MDHLIIPESATLGETIAVLVPACGSDPQSRAAEWVKQVTSAAFLDSIPKHLEQLSLLFMEWMNLLEHARLGLPAKDIPREVLEIPSTYHSTMHHLWQCEFSLANTAVPPNFWEHCRLHATMSAGAFRVAAEWRYLASGGKAMTDSTAKNIDPVAMLPPKIAPSINVTPWLYQEAHPYMPHYLWDLKEKATVEVSKLSTKPDYIAISHTWGRFRKMTGDQYCYVDLPGVPWPVPELQSSKFNVVELPDMLNNGLGHKTGYVWIDLCCIPQDRSPLSLQEIGRQASIFRNSTATVAWLNEINGWRATQETLQFLCALTLQDWNREVLAVPHTAKAPSPPQSQGLELCSGEFLNPWFTSLWTLQEICLCPKMEIHDRNFEPLRVADGLRPLSFWEIQALVDSAVPAKEESTNVKDLNSMLRNVMLPGKETWSPMTILQLGNQRYCEERRAEAVMSVVGTVEWFTLSSPAMLQGPESLILELYPPAFIAEVRKNYGSGMFFHAAEPKHGIISSLVFDKIPPSDFENFGSMLPFGPGTSSAGLPSTFGQTSEPTTESWPIDQQGRVHIAEAFIQLSQDTFDPSLELQCTFNAPAMTESTLFKDHWAELGQDYPQLCRWIKDFQPQTRNYAVRVTFGNLWCQGVLLKELKPGVLLKVGTYILGRVNIDIAWPGANQKHLKWVVL